MIKTAQRPRTQSTKAVFSGTPLSAGIGIGAIYHYHDILSREIETVYLPADEIQAEIRRFRIALARARAEIRRLERQAHLELPENEATILSAHRLALEDKALSSAVEEGIRARRVNAEAAVKDVFSQQERGLRERDTAMLQARLDDIHDLIRTLLGHLLGSRTLGVSSTAMPSVIVARRILPSDIIHFNMRNVSGIVTYEGAMNAHAAILAREYDLPFIAHVSTNDARIAEGVTAVVDAYRGKLVISPRPSELTRYRKEQDKAGQQFREQIARTRRYRLEINGERIRVLASTFVPSDVTLARRCGSDGIGLYRLEATYMSFHRPPTEEELYSVLSRAVHPMRKQETTVRLLDTGGDKTIPYLAASRESTSPLGLRGIRLLLRNRDLLRPQLRALLRLSAERPIKILLPMVTSPEEIKLTRKAIAEEMERLRREDVAFNSSVHIGTMIETPAALMMVEQLLDEADFVSIGSNDLVQYTVAADRQEADMESYYDQGVKMIVDFLEPVIRAARNREKECVLCGELAIDRRFTKRLLDIGLRAFSAIPHAIPDLKEHLCTVLR